MIVFAYNVEMSGTDLVLVDWYRAILRSVG